MKDVIINGMINFITKNNKYDDTKIEELKYGLLSIYLLVTKLIVIMIISLLLGIFKEVLIYTLIYIPIRTVSFGLHATKGWICLIVSITTFVGIPLICTLISIPLMWKIIIGLFLIILFLKNSPADTHKRPIINKKRRLFFKYSSTLIAIIYCLICITNNNRFISNCLLFALINQSFLISPTVYKIFKLPYDNYKTYTMN